MQFLLHLCLLLATLSITLSAKNDVTYLSYDSPTIQNQVAYQDEKHSYCIRPIVAMKFSDLKLSDSSDGNDVDALFGLMHALDEVVITIKTTSASDTLSWHSVKGISTDDLHTLTEAAIFKIFAYPQSEHDVFNSAVVTANLSSKQSFVRDIFSSCPSPLFSFSRSICEMPFSAFGVACVSIVPERDVTVDVHVTKRVNRRLHTYIPIGFLLAYFAGTLAKSKIFQYSSAVAVSAVAGAILLLMYVLKSLVFSIILPRNTRTDAMSVIMTGVFVFTFLFLFGATSLWYLRNTMRLNVLILENWEISLGYFVVSAAVGLCVTRLLRRNEKSKHSLILGVKWVLRSVGAALVYNSFSSPLVSALLVASMAALYLVYAFNKFVLFRFLNRSRGQDKKKK